MRKLSGWQWLALLGLLYLSFVAGAMLGSEVIYIVEDSPTINNGWTDVLQEVAYGHDSSGCYAICEGKYLAGVDRCNDQQPYNPGNQLCINGKSLDRFNCRSRCVRFRRYEKERRKRRRRQHRRRTSYETDASVPYQGKQARNWLVCSPDYAIWRGTQQGRDTWQERDSGRLGGGLLLKLNL